MRKSKKHQLIQAAILGLSLSLSTVSNLAIAAETTAAASQTKQYTVSAGSLSHVLSEFANQAGILLSADAKLTQGKNSAGLTGAYSVDDALKQLLKGSDIDFNLVGNTVTLEASAIEVETLGVVRVSDSSIGERAYGPVDGYVATRSAIATKTNTSLLETPQSISVVTRDQIAIRNAQTDSQVLLYVPGVWAQPFGGEQNQNNPFFYIRGFSSSFGGSYVDGLVSPVNYRYEPFGTERVDVFRGPTSALYGQSDPGGMVNRTTKRPTEKFQGEVQAQMGSFDRRQLAGDVSGPIDEDGRVLYRLTGLIRDADSPLDYDFNANEPDNRKFIAPSLTIRPTDDTSFTLLTSFLKDEVDAASTITNSAGELTHINLEQRGFGVYDYEQSLIGYAFEHKFNENFELRQNLRWSKMDLDTVGIFQISIDDVARTVGRETFGFSEKREDFVVDTHLESTFSTGLISHTFLSGIDYQNLADEIEFSFGAAPDLNFDSPNYNLSIPPATPFIQSDIDSSNVGIYLQEQAKINDRWIVTLGGRYDWSRATIKDRLSGDKTKEKDEEFTYRAGLSYVTDSGLAPYVSYATSYFPTGGVDANGNPFDPTTGEQVEVGLKYKPTAFNGFFAVSLYDLTRQNVLTPNAANPLIASQTGEVRSRGLELEGTIDLENGLNATASYTYNDVEVTKDNPNFFGISKEGKRATLAPEHLASAWLDYTFQGGQLQGLLLGGGVRYVGSSFADGQNTIKNKSYTLFDAVIRYDLSHLSKGLRGASLAVNASNVFGKEYITCFTRFDCQWGGERTVTGTLTYKW